MPLGDGHNSNAFKVLFQFSCENRFEKSQVSSKCTYSSMTIVATKPIRTDL